MNAIDKFFANDMVQWVHSKIEELPNQAKFRAYNAIRSLNWASRIYNANVPIPANYCALHATEEAVAAFISSVKVAGYGDDAKINIRDHHAKAAVSLLAQKTVSLVKHFSPAIALHTKTDTIVMKIVSNDEIQYSPASMSVFTHHNDDDGEISTDYYDEFKKSFDSLDELRELLKRGHEARVEIFYADDEGMPTGFEEPETSLLRECHLTVGLIWAAIDVTRHNGTKVPFYTQSLKTAKMLIEETKRKKDKCQTCK